MTPELWAALPTAGKTEAHKHTNGACFDLELVFIDAETEWYDKQQWRLEPGIEKKRAYHAYLEAGVRNVAVWLRSNKQGIADADCWVTNLADPKLARMLGYKRFEMGITLNSADAVARALKRGSIPKHFDEADVVRWCADAAKHYPTVCDEVRILKTGEYVLDVYEEYFS